ncbi:MAG: hypothetical protein CMM78_12005 [Rhodospirillaceae bacterium]|mgnify:CR=1 FL=1|jgi:ElaB/YqjD/DUF883 family membrane-anchored ribosome-binding protein|uniref:DUF883 family protein n=1 Tax=unclassified Hwanghaeella TaxID=2605944 RepID=UPI000C694A8C|nr:hypothetical protein [Rhodospirillales bacterium]MAX48925.1 hypothetical protein [Rhodospirillaceae bacterium]|tara:strand:- start:2654 stop:2941 length:288 start_codon:yes stop_codon:yes gene_type:complete
MATAKENSAADIEELRADLNNLRNDMKQLLNHFGDSSESRTEQLKERLSAASHQAGERLTAAKTVADAKVAENPMSAIAIAFGIGLVAGKILDRR